MTKLNLIHLAVLLILIILFASVFVIQPDKFKKDKPKQCKEPKKPVICDCDGKRIKVSSCWRVRCRLYCPIGGS